MTNPSRFDSFAARRIEEAETAPIEQLRTMSKKPAGRALHGVGNAWTRAHFDGDFEVVVTSADETALSLVFVQSADGNTGGGDPAALGGGPTDKHLIYEGLSRVAADAVLAGAATVHRDALFSIWHPELVAVRLGLGLPRHPTQIVISKHGRLNPDALVFNVPDIPVVLVGGEECVSRHAAWLGARPWVRFVPLIAGDLRSAIDRLRDEAGVRRISAVGGRFTASRLIDAGLVQDIYLTTSSQQGGEPGTPWYTGTAPPRLDVITKKQWVDHGASVVFEHALLAGPRAPADTLPI